MTDMDRFETRLAKWMEARADLAERPFDAVAVAHGAVNGPRGRRRVWDVVGTWGPTSRFARLLVAVLLIAILAAGAVLVGSQLLTPSPAPSPERLPEVVHSSGVLAVRTGWFFDLDEGRLIDGFPDDDVILYPEPALYLEPTRGALALGELGDPASPIAPLFGHPTVGLKGCLAALAAPNRRSASPPPSGSDPEATGAIPLSALNDASHLCVRTSEGRILGVLVRLPASEHSRRADLHPRLHDLGTGPVVAGIPAWPCGAKPHLERSPHMSVRSRALAASALALMFGAPLVAAADPSASVTAAPPWQLVEPNAAYDVPNAGGAISLATDGMTVWAAGDGEMLRIDGATGAVDHLAAPVATGDTFLLFATDGLWATQWQGGTVYRLDPMTGAVELALDVPSAVDPQLVGQELWVGREDQGEMIHVDRLSGALGTSIRLGAYAQGSPDALWFAVPGDPPTVVRVDPASGATVATIAVPAGTGCAIAGTVPDALFTSSCFGRDAETRTFARIDPLTNTVVSTTELPATHGGNPVVAGGSIWLVGAFDAPDDSHFAGLVRVDPVSGAAQQWISLPGVEPDGSIGTANAIWVPDEGGHRVLRYDIASLAGQ